MRDRDDEFDLDEDTDEDDAVLMPCPHCSASIYDDSEQCPRCGAYLSREDLPHRRPRWIVLAVIVSLIVVATWIVQYR